ncbi:MAG: hypothetical protein ACPGJV_10865 [Bacteriovoracaceae bacterium]
MRILIATFTLLLSFNLFAEGYIIYSIGHEISMGFKDNETMKKNFYINMGKSQGLEAGSEIDVYRTITRQDPYETKKRFNHKVKIGKLKVVHTENNSSIAIVAKNSKSSDILFEVRTLMIGDSIAVSVD